MSVHHSFTRRQALTLGGAALLAPVWARPAAALTTAQAETLVFAAADDINAIIASGASVDRMVRGFAAVFEAYSDTAYVAAYALGNDGRRATDAQKRAFGDAFALYLANKYGRRFNEIAGGRLEVQQSRQINSFIEVETMAIVPGRSPFRIDFHVSDRPGRPAFFNLVIEGINMLLSERAEIGAMLDARGGNLDALIRDLA